MKKRTINWLFVHHSGSNNPEHANIETLRKWHKARGWKDVGYHYAILPCGKVEEGRAEGEIGAHCQGHNKDSIGICLIGKFEKDNPDMQPTKEQLESLEILLIDLCSRYDLQKIDILGHCDVMATECPGFDLHAWLATRNWH